MKDIEMNVDDQKLNVRCLQERALDALRQLGLASRQSLAERGDALTFEALSGEEQRILRQMQADQGTLFGGMPERPHCCCDWDDPYHRLWHMGLLNHVAVHSGPEPVYGFVLAEQGAALRPNAEDADERSSSGG